MNLLQLPAKDVNAYGRSLLDLLFTKAEQAISVVLPTKKSNKQPLSPQRVQLLFGKSYWHNTAINFDALPFHYFQIV